MKADQEKKRSPIVLSLVVVGVCAFASHSLAAWLGIKIERPEWRAFGGTAGEPIIVLGSSLTFFGFDWGRVAEATGSTVRGMGVPAASPAELEPFLPQESSRKPLVIGISAFDMIESSISDFRAEVVPFSRTMADLWAIRAGGEDAKRVISQYPMRGVRLIFPTAGRSLAVMVGLRAKGREMLRGATEKPTPDS